MVSDNIIPKIKRIIIQTKQNKINWRPFKEFYDYKANNNIVQFFPIQLQNEFTELNLSESFYAEKNGELIFFISCNWISGKDGSVSLHRELMVSCSIYGDMITVPNYDATIMEELINTIKEYWENKSYVYNREISDIFDVLSTFAADK